MPRKKPKSEVPLERTWPLESEQHEAFVREYLDCYDGPKAALSAGFEKPLLVWQELLERDDVKARLRGYKVGTDTPSRSATAISNYLVQTALAPRKKVLVADIVTGQMRPNWKIIEEQDSDFVEYDEIFQNKGGIHTRTTRLHKRGTFEAKKMVMQQLETLVQNSSQTSNPLMHAYMQLSRKGSKAPIVKQDCNYKP